MDTAIDTSAIKQNTEAVKNFFDNIVSTNLILAAVIGLAGFFLIKLIMKLVKRGLKKSKIDQNIHALLLSAVKISLYILLALTIASFLGIPVSAFIAVLSVFGIAVSLAVKDSLANLSGGLLLLFTKPFSVGDFVEIGSISGTVIQIGVIHTRLNTIDNKQIFIPNSDVSTSTITNYSAEEKRRVDLTFCIGYDQDVSFAKKCIASVVLNHPEALKEPEPLIRVGGYRESSVEIVCRVWVLRDRYWDLFYDLNEQVREQFDLNGITIPYNQLDVHIKSDQKQP